MLKERLVRREKMEKVVPLEQKDLQVQQGFVVILVFRV